MKKFLLYFIYLIVLVSCGNMKHVPTETKTIYNYIDSTIISYRDSIIFIEVPVERIVDVIAQYDTSKLETTIAESTAYVDTTTHTLKHSLNNKKVELKEKIKVEYKDRIIYKDSLIYKEIPVKVEVEKVKYPTVFWWLLGWAILCLIIFIIKIYKKFAI